MTQSQTDDKAGKKSLLFLIKSSELQKKRVKIN